MTLGPWHKAVIGGVTWLNTMDAVTTVIGLTSGAAYEKNPIAATLMESGGLWPYMAFKLALGPATAIFIFWWYDHVVKKPALRSIGWVCNAALIMLLGGAVVNNLGVLYGC